MEEATVFEPREVFGEGDRVVCGVFLVQGACDKQGVGVGLCHDRYGLERQDDLFTAHL